MYAKLKTIIIAFVIIFMTMTIILFPEQALKSSIHGLHTWWEVVFPSLLPFFIMAELLISFGIVQFVGILFEPIMRPLFNVPGSGSFAWILGMISGFPSGAKMTVLLREKKEISKIEAERLLSFSNAASPLFIFGAIAVGFFHNVHLGIVIAFSHYASNIIVGLVMKYHAQKQDQEIIKTKKNSFQYKTLIRRAFSQMHQTRIQEARPFGQLFGDAVLTSIQTLLMIGGFIILFSVLTTLLQLTYITNIIEVIALPFLTLFHIPKDTISAMMTGFFEITMGADAVSNMTSIPLVWQLVLVSFILGFNGFSIQAQVASLIAKTDIRFQPYFFSRIIHAIIASLFTFILYTYCFKQKLDTVDTITAPTALSLYMYEIIAVITKYGPIITILSLFVGTAILARRFSYR